MIRFDGILLQRRVVFKSTKVADRVVEKNHLVAFRWLFYTCPSKKRPKDRPRQRWTDRKMDDGNGKESERFSGIVEKALKMCWADAGVSGSFGSHVYFFFLNPSPGRASFRLFNRDVGKKQFLKFITSPTVWQKEKNVIKANRMRSILSGVCGS